MAIPEWSLAECVLPFLEERYPDAWERPGGPRVLARFPEAQPEVGAVVIYDDGDELTVLVENISHIHINPYDEELVGNDRCGWMLERLAHFLDPLFRGEMLLWRSPNGSGGFQWSFDLEAIPGHLGDGREFFTWTTRLR